MISYTILCYSVMYFNTIFEKLLNLRIILRFYSVNTYQWISRKPFEYKTFFHNKTYLLSSTQHNKEKQKLNISMHINFNDVALAEI